MTPLKKEWLPALPSTSSGTGRGKKHFFFQPPTGSGTRRGRKIIRLPPFFAKETTTFLAQRRNDAGLFKILTNEDPMPYALVAEALFRAKETLIFTPQFSLCR